MLSAFEDAQELYPKDSWKQKTILLHLKKLNNLPRRWLETKATLLHLKKPTNHT
jgi:hypothetical protein